MWQRRRELQEDYGRGAVGERSTLAACCRGVENRLPVVEVPSANRSTQTAEHGGLEKEVLCGVVEVGAS